MALDSTTLQGLIESKVEAAGFEFNDKSSFKVLSQAIAEAVVEHIQSDAQVDSGTYKVK